MENMVGICQKEDLYFNLCYFFVTSDAVVITASFVC